MERNHKVLFIALGNLYLYPSFKKYLSVINKGFDVVLWNKDNIDESIGEDVRYSFNYSSKNKVSKIIGYIEFRNFVKKIITKQNYDCIIVGTTKVGVLIKRTLIRYYRYRYILDIRDYSLESNPIYFTIERHLINNSALNIISSYAFKSFLPKSKYVLVHNDTIIDPKVISKFKAKKRSSEQIVISYIGAIRFFEQCKRVIEKFGNDVRFYLRFIGKGSDELRKYCNTPNIANVEFIDWFPPEKTLEYYFSNDIVYNLYGNNSPLLDYALSNKLYYAAKLNMPILVSPHTFMEEVSLEYNFGFSFDLNDLNACDKLYKYYINIDWKKFENDTNRFLEKVNLENIIFSEEVSNIINDK